MRDVRKGVIMSENEILGPVPYVRPAITEESKEYWTGGERGELRIFQCNACKHYIHPPASVCRYCRSLDVKPQTVSGRGRLVSYTINHQQWGADFSGPFVVAFVEIEEEPGLHLTTNILDCPVDELVIGMSLRVDFVQLEDSWLPVFRPVA